MENPYQYSKAYAAEPKFSGVFDGVSSFDNPSFISFLVPHSFGDHTQGIFDGVFGLFGKSVD